MEKTVCTFLALALAFSQTAFGEGEIGALGLEYLNTCAIEPDRSVDSEFCCITNNCAGQHCLEETLCAPCCFEITGWNDALIVPFYTYAAGELIGIDENYHKVGAFMSFPAYCSTFLLQGNALFFEDDKVGASVGAGLRFGDCCCNGTFFGFNLFYDYLDADVDAFHQYSVGIEALNLCCFDIRANFYFPIFSDKKSSIKTFDFEGGYSSTCFEEERAPSIAQLEVGRCICLPCSSGLSVYPAVGPYYLSFCDKSTLGVLFRAAVMFRGFVGAEVLVSHDAIYNTRVQGQFTLSIPFRPFNCPCHCRTSCCYGKSVPIERFDTIFLRKCCNWTWNW